MNEPFDKKQDSVYSKRLKAGKRRTYFFDVRSTRGNDYFLTITESRKRMTDDGYDRHKIFLYKEDFHKFLRGLNEAVSFIKTELMPDFNFDAFNHDLGDDTDMSDESSTADKPVIATDSPNNSAFDGMTGMDKPAMDKTSALPSGKIAGTDGNKKESAPDQKPAPGAGNTEEVERW